MRDLRDNMENQSGTSQLRKNLVARGYKRHARKTLKLVKVNITVMTLSLP
jgi:hypothetical protein